MKNAVFRGSLAVSGLATAVIALAVAASIFAGGCGEAGTPGTSAEGGQTMTSAVPQLPPIDLAAPTSFETASFALG